MTLAEIGTDRLTLRPYDRDDVETLHRLWIDPEVRRYLWDDAIIARGVAAAVVHDSHACFAERGVGQWALRLTGQPALVGFCGYRPTGAGGDVELLYGLAPAQWHQGLATEAARAVLRYGFETARLERVLATTDAPNTASIRVLERLGMRQETDAVIDDQALRSFLLKREDFRPTNSTYRVSFT